MLALASPDATHLAEAPAPRPSSDLLRCRQIEDADIAGVADLLAEGFPRRSRPAWAAALRRLGTHRAPDGFPRFGYMLERGGVAVGVLLLISASIPADGRAVVRCNVSSWYVRPEYRLYAPLLVTRARKSAAASFVNISPAAPTWPIIEAQGFRRFSHGAVAAVPLLRPMSGAGEAVCVGECSPEEPGLAAGEWRLLDDHREFGCISLCCRSGGRVTPFVFRRRMVSRFPLPCAQLIYCRHIKDVARCAGPVGRFLARRGMGWILAAADDPIRGLPGGTFPQRQPMYVAGAAAPRPGDLAYTEAAIFGV